MSKTAINAKVKPGEGGLLSSGDLNGKLTHKVVKTYKKGTATSTGGIHNAEACMTTTQKGGVFMRLGDLVKAQSEKRISGILTMSAKPDEDGAYTVTGIENEFGLTWKAGRIEGA